MGRTGEDARASCARRWLVLGAATALFVCSQFYRVANAVVAPELQRDLRLSSAALGGLSAAFFYPFALAQLPLALVLDRLGARRVMTALSLVGAAGAIVFSGARGEAEAVLGRALLGVGMAANLVGSLKLVTGWFPAHRFASVAGLLVAAGTVGNMLATTPLAALVRAAGWRVSFGLIAAGTVVLSILFWIVVRDTPAAPTRRATPGGTSPPAGMVRSLLRSQDYWLISAGAFCRYGAFLALQGLWAGPYLMEGVGLSQGRAAAVLLLMNIGFVIGAPLGGWLSDRVLSSRRTVALISLVGIAGSLVALAADAVRERPWAVTLVLVVLAATAAFGQVMYVHIKELMPPEMAGMAMTGVNGFVMLGAAMFVHGMGWMMQQTSAGTGAGGSYGRAFMVASAVVALAAVLYGFTRDTGPVLRTSQDIAARPPSA